MDSLINIGLYVAYFALFIAISLLVIFPIITLLKGNFKNAKATLIGIVALFAIMVLAYILSPADQGLFYTKTNTSAGMSKLIGAGLLTTYFIFAGLVIIIVYTSVANWFK
jgi:hypothetical protein